MRFLGGAVIVLLAGFLLGLTVRPGPAMSQPPEPKVCGVFQGDTVYTVLPPGGITAIKKPEFLSGREAAGQMSPDEMVMGILVGGEARAYSLWYLDAHGIVNDSIAGIPVAATWEPLCHTGVVYVREVGYRTITLIASGKLWRNSLVMQDEESGTLWSHITGEAFDGPMRGEILETIPSVQTTWSQWIGEHPDTKVLKQESAVRGSRYDSYFQDPERTGLFRVEWLRERLPGKSIVYGITRGSSALAVTGDRLASAPLLNTRVGRDSLVICRSDDGGVRAFVSRVNGLDFRFTVSPEDGGIHDAETDSIWDLKEGISTSGRLRGTRLTEVKVLPAYWFAWSNFYPRTDVID